MSELVLTEVSGHTGIITLNRPKQLNALNGELMVELGHALKAFDADAQIGCIIITGSEKAFAAGADIAAMAQFSFAEVYNHDFITRDWETIRSFRKPVIAAVSGFALGGGLELAMACDFRIANTKAKFGQPEVNLGLIPGFAGTQRLPRLVGTANALFLLMSAEMIGAEEALRIGLVQKVTEPEELLNEALRIAKLIASKGPKAVQLIKKVVRVGLAMGFEAGNELEAIHFGSLFGAGSEGEEGMKAFLEKRAPNW